MSCLIASTAFFSASTCGDDAAWAIYVMQADGSGVRKVVRLENFRAHGSPRWSHDGKRLVFDASGGPNGARKFFVINVDGSGLKELGDHAMPDWSLDDKQLIYTNYGGAGTKVGLWVQNLDGQGRTWVVEGISARWSPDGSHFVYMDAPERLVMSFDVVQGDERVLYDGGYERIEPGFEWSPDGKRLAVIGCNRDNNQKARELVIVGGNGTEAKVRLKEPLLEGPVSWTPDGRRLAVAVDHKICILDVDGAAAPTEIIGQVGRNSDPAWSPGGKQMAFTSDRE